ncbi:MAG: hypothetical protein H6582_08220 [Crocinitomicaceae bacterium]|nr:hypothetical protein [Crocinitomicaceae bacterium]
MELGEMKNELLNLQKKNSYSPQDIEKVTRMATMIIQSPRISDAHKKEFADRINMIKNKGVANLQPGDVKMMLGLFIQGLS